jgi:glycosyltransferase involved in cell wall biosynthesis
MRDPRVCVLHVIDGLDVGGAQSVLRGILALADRSRFRLLVANVGGGWDTDLVEAVRREADGLLGLRPRGLWDARALVALARAIRSERVDVVHTHLAGGDVLGGLAGRLTGRPVVATVHSVAAWRLSYRRTRRLLADLALRRLVGHAFAVSSAVRDSHVAEIGLQPERVEVLPNVPVAPHLLRPDFDREAVRRELAADGPVLATASRLTPERDHATLLRALPRALERHPGLRLLVLGDGPSRLELERLSRELGMGAAVRFLGTRADAAEIVAASDFFCQPTRLEGLPVAVLDAMALGVPVIASRIDATEELLEDGRTGLLVRPGDADQLADALCRFLDDPAEAAAMAAAARAHVESSFDPGTWIARIEQVYLQAARRAAPSPRPRSESA